MNTRSRKRITARHALETNTDKILMDSKHFFTLANMMDDDSYVHLIQRDTCLYDIQDLNPDEIETRLRMKKKVAKKWRMQRIRRHAELRVAEVKLLRRELRITHKRIEQRTEKCALHGGVANIGTKGKELKDKQLKKRNRSHLYGGDRTTNPPHQC